ncbi:MAG: nickel-dependent lactate racemase [Acidobacteriota bacterium]
MTVKLAYGRSGLEVDFGDIPVDIIEPRFIEGLSDERAALQEALAHPVAARPLKETARPDDTVAIIFSDRTRAMPSDRVLPVILDELSHVARENITLINALGTHRENTPEELESMLGRSIVENFRIVQHRPKDKSSMVHLGRSRFGNEVWVNRDFVEAKVKILTGFIEPHFFAGYSGGPKAVLLGVGAFESILRNHSAPMIDSPNATFGITEGNPIYEEMSAIAELVKPDFIVNVTLNKHRAITGVFAGSWKEAHARGCAFAKECVMRPVPDPYNIVVTTNSGFPLDMNLYQAVKGMTAAERIVRQGGTIVIAAECSDGLPAHGNFKELLQSRRSAAELLEMVRGFQEPVQDQWQVQILARVLLKADVALYSSLPQEDVRKSHLRPVSDIAGFVRERRARLLAENKPCRVAVLPEGPQTIPYLSD